MWGGLTMRKSDPVSTSGCNHHSEKIKNKTHSSWKCWGESIMSEPSFKSRSSISFEPQFYQPAILTSRLGWKLAISSFAFSSCHRVAQRRFTCTAIYLKPPRPRPASRLKHNRPSHPLVATYPAHLSKRKTTKQQIKMPHLRRPVSVLGAVVIKSWQNFHIKTATLSFQDDCVMIKTNCQLKKNSSISELGLSWQRYLWSQWDQHGQKLK